MVKSKFKSSVLPYVIVLSVVLLVLCLSFLLIQIAFDKNYKNLLKQNEIEDKLASSVCIINSGFNFDDNHEVKVKLFQQFNDSVVFIKKKWGVFEIYRIKFNLENQKIEKVGLWGGSYNFNKEPSLYISNHNNTLTIGENTILNGKCLIPGGVMKTTNGSMYRGDLKIENSNSNLECLTINNISFNVFDSADSVLLTENCIKTGMSFSNLFSNKILLIKSDNSIDLNNVSLKGNIVVNSRKTIIIRSECNLDNIIVKAKNVIVENNFKGRLQIFAEDSIVIGNSCVLRYPSALICENKNNSTVKIMENSTVSGGVLMIGSKGTLGERGLIIMSPTSTVYGLVCTLSNIDFKGRIIGALYCDKILTEQKSMFYENNIVNAVLNDTKLPEYFSIPMILNGKSRKLVGWLE